MLLWIALALVIAGAAIASAAGDQVMASVLLVIGLCFLVAFRWTERL